MEEENKTIAEKLHEMNLVLEEKVLALDEANQLLKTTQEQLVQSQKLEALGKLAGGIAHDFNNLLGAILGYANLLKNEFSTNPPIYKKLSIIEMSAQRGAELTRQLLGFARKGQYEKKKIDLNQSIQETCQLLSRSLDKNINIQTEFESSLWPIEGDGTQIQQVLMNLGVNARDAMPYGGDLMLSSRNIIADKAYCQSHKKLKPGNYVRISISDTGLGISKEIQDKIFDPFFTTKPVGKGTGLGLSMVYGIMGNHNGVISVYSELNQGTIFHLYFPAMEGAAADQKNDSEIHEQDDFHKRLREERCLEGKKFLIVDDEKNIRELVGDILRSYGAIVSYSTNGEEAIKEIEDGKRVDQVILDVIMPKMDGIQAFFKMRMMNPELPVLFCSGYSENSEMTELRRINHVDFIQKPFCEDSLLKKIVRQGEGT